MGNRLRTRAARGTRSGDAVSGDPDVLARVLEDAAHYPGGHASGVAFPRSEADVAHLVRSHDRVLAVGAQSSVTGGATPFGELVLSTARMTGLAPEGASHLVAQAGVSLVLLEEAARAIGGTYPAAPTYTGALVGGVVATNAAGAATFKYGSTRHWVDALTVVLANGEVLDVRRGEHAEQGGLFVIETGDGLIDVPVPSYAMPEVPKVSAGYYARPGMDLIDLFIGSEGTLGIITEATIRVLSPAPAAALALIVCADEATGLAIVGALREATRATWRSRDRAGIDAAAIEHLDRRALQIATEDGAAAKLNVTIAAGADLALLVQLDLPPGTSAEAAYDQVANALSDDGAGTPLGRFCRLLDDYGVLDTTELAAPGDRHRIEQLLAFREAVPAGVNQRVGAAKRDIDPRIAKTAGDMIVPFDRFPALMEAYRRGFGTRGLDYAVWGHASDGNVHPNVIPRSYADVVAGQEAMLAFGREVIRMGGSPLAEHGVGRNPIKQALLRELYGDDGIEQMRAVKRALDPGWKLAPGVIFPAGV